MGGIQTNGGGDLSFRFAKQMQQGARENGLEQQMKRGNYENVSVEQSIVDVASRFIIVDQEKLRRLEAQANA